MIRGIAHFVKKENKKSMNVDRFKQLKTLCTTTIVNAYLVIDKYKQESLCATQEISERMVSDSYRFSKKKTKQFLTRNFSRYSRRNGRDLQKYVFLILTVIILYVMNVLP